MKQCPTCGHRTNDDVCPVCGAATVALQNDPQEKAQRTIQYQRFDPSKAPGATAGGQAVPTGNRYTQKDPGAMHHMQQRAGMIPPQGGQQAHPAKAASQPNPQGQPAAPAQPTQPPVAPEAPAPQSQNPAQNPAQQQPAAGESRNITYQNVNEFRPSTLPRRSQKYRQKYSSYVPSEPAAEAAPTSQTVSGIQDAQTQNISAPAPQKAATTSVDPGAQPAPEAQATPAIQAALADLAAQSPQPVQPAAESPQAAPVDSEPQATPNQNAAPAMSTASGAPEAPSAPDDPTASQQAAQTTQATQAAQAAPVDHAAQAAQTAQAAQSAQTEPTASDPKPVPAAQEPAELHTESNADAPAADEKPAAHHVLLSPEELEAFLDNQPDDAEEDGLPEMQEEAEAPKPTENTEISSDHSESNSSETPESLEIPDNADDAEPVDIIGDTDSEISTDNVDNTGESDPANAESNADESASADNTAESDENNESGENQTGEEPEDEPEEEHLPTRQELIQRQNAQIRRENNRKYAEEHASRAARRWQEESEQEPFAIVRGTCYYSALESETTVRGNFSKKRYKDDELPQNEPVSYEDSEWYQGFENAYDPWGDYVEPDEKEKKKGVSYKAWFIILLLILFWPAGLILMWVRKKFPLAVRIIITLIIAAGLAFEGYFLYNYGPAMYEEYMYGDSSNITYETPASDSGSSDSDTTQNAAATENQQKALDKANEYIDTLALSHDGLIKQLEYDGYATDVATYAADNCSANWNKEAKEMAEQYMESTSYTYKSMVQQLEADGFTKDQAKFGAKAAGLK